MRLLDNKSLEASNVVANSRMNRERVATGVNSYQREISLNVIEFLESRLRYQESVSWLDLCCGQGLALIEVAKHFLGQDGLNPDLKGIDLVGMFADEIPECEFLHLEKASIHGYVASGTFDLVTCVHGLHYIGDKLGLLARAASWLTDDGVLVANLDVNNLRFSNNSSMARLAGQWMKDNDLNIAFGKSLVSCSGRKQITLPFEYIGASDTAGPNNTGQEAVNSFYRTQ